MPDLFKQTISTNGNGAQRNVTYRATVKLTLQGVRAITEAFGPDYAIVPEVIIGDASDGAPCLIIYDEKSRPWLLAGATVTPESPGLRFLPKGVYDPTLSYPKESVVAIPEGPLNAEGEPTQFNEYHATADVPVGVAPPNPPWQNLFQAFHADATQDPVTGEWTASTPEGFGDE